VETRSQAAIAERATQVEPGTLRHQALMAAQKFKSTWVELGALLVKVRDSGDWSGWGFKSFDDYCSKELHIKKQTALKLTHSFGFLSRHEKSLMREDEPPARAPPPFEVVSVLAGAEERGQLTESDYQDLREKIWSDERPANQVVRELSERFPTPPKPPPAADLVVRRLAVAARRLANELRACDKVPGPVAERAAALAEDVEELAGRERQQ
jgi:hypothetical protein